MWDMVKRLKKIHRRPRPLTCAPVLKQNSEKSVRCIFSIQGHRFHVQVKVCALYPAINEVCVWVWVGVWVCIHIYVHLNIYKYMYMYI